MKQTRGTKRVVLTTHELGLSTQKTNIKQVIQKADVLRAELRKTIAASENLRQRSHSLCEDAKKVWGKIREEAKKRPVLVRIKKAPLDVMPCQENCVESQCEHYHDCLSIINMFKYLMSQEPDEKTLLHLYMMRNEAIDSWQKKGIFRSCMFKVPHPDPIAAQAHVDSLQRGASDGVHFYFYECKYGNHYHVAHTKASAASLRERHLTAKAFGLAVVMKIGKLAFLVAAMHAFHKFML